MSWRATEARIAKNAQAERWRKHQLNCAECALAARQRRPRVMCCEGAAINKELAEAVAELAKQKHLDTIPTPGQITLI